MAIEIGNLIKMKPHEDGRVRTFPMWNITNTQFGPMGYSYSSESLPVMVVRFERKAKRPNAAFPTPFIVTVLHNGKLWNFRLKSEWNLNAMFQRLFDNEN